MTRTVYDQLRERTAERDAALARAVRAEQERDGLRAAIADARQVLDRTGWATYPPKGAKQELRDLSIRLAVAVVGAEEPTGPSMRAQAGVAIRAAVAEYVEAQRLAEEPTDQATTQYYVPCGCNLHGDHLGCEHACKSGRSCAHPLGKIVTRPGPTDQAEAQQ